MSIVGIDPGLSGAIAIYDPMGGTLVVHDMPTIGVTRNQKAKRELDTTEFARIVDAAGPVSHVFIELVGAMPGQGTSSMFSFGRTTGRIEGVIAAIFVPTTWVSPAKWKRSLGVPADKYGSRARASQLMPEHARNWTRAKDDGRAEAALIAYWGFRHMPGMEDAA